MLCCFLQLFTLTISLKSVSQRELKQRRIFLGTWQHTDSCRVTVFHRVLERRELVLSTSLDIEGLGARVEQEIYHQIVRPMKHRKADWEQIQVVSVSESFREN
jgi:hypothetical protein